jgi:DNA-binding XRE family transcriptional regulator
LLPEREPGYITGGLPMAKKKGKKRQRTFQPDNDGRGRRHAPYTKYGERISALGTQAVLAKALGMSQQTISKKLRGKCAIFVSDLEKLSKKFKKPMRYFVLWWDGDWGCGLGDRHVSVGKFVTLSSSA